MSKIERKERERAVMQILAILDPIIKDKGRLAEVVTMVMGALGIKRIRL